MLTAEALHELVRNTKANRALAGALLPANNNASMLELDTMSSLTIVDINDDNPAVDASPVAFGVYNTYTPSQIYCTIVKTSAKYDGKFVNIEPIDAKAAQLDVDEKYADRHFVYRIVDVRDRLPDLGSFAQYYKAFAEPAARPLHQAIVDELIRLTVGEKDLDIKRNISVDIYEASDELAEGTDELWRDSSGFIVADKHRFAEFEVEKRNFEAVMKTAIATMPDDEQAVAVALKMAPLSASNEPHFVDYDQELSIIDREAYLKYLFSLSNIRGTVALDGEQPVGYILSLNDRILQCYGNTSAIACTLMAKHVGGLDVAHISLFMAAQEKAPFLELAKSARVVRRVRRFHTRLVPSNVKWPQCFAFNMGLHLF